MLALDRILILFLLVANSITCMNSMTTDLRGPAKPFLYLCMYHIELIDLATSMIFKSLSQLTLERLNYMYVRGELVLVYG